MKQFTINNYTAEAWTENTRNGFRHRAELYNKAGELVATAKINYYNRTWEAFEYESVLHKLIDISELPNKQEAIKQLSNKDDNKALNLALAFGNLISESDNDRNEWRVRMLKAQFGDGLSLPDDWDELDEATKTKRLNKIEQLLKEV